MTRRINRAIELLAQGQAIYYVGGHTGHRLTHDRGGRTRTSGLIHQCRDGARLVRHGGARLIHGRPG